MVLVATQVKRRRGTNDENDAFAGAEGEITVDLTNKELRVHDGSGKKGGFRIGHYSYTSNSIEGIPQDIKLELSNGTLTLKAGSKVYVPNGAGVFDEITIANDISVSGASTSANTVRLLYYINGNLNVFVANSSGTTPPTSGTNQMFYNTSDNTIKRYTNGAVVTSGYSFPLALIKDDGTYLHGSINQVFNGFGYIGSTVFALSGLEYLCPNGRNSDGTLKNTRNKLTTCAVRTEANTAFGGKRIINITGGGTIVFDSLERWFVQEQEPPRTNYNIWENPATNEIYQYIDGQWNKRTSCVLGITKETSGKIDSFSRKQVFRAVDYNDTEYIAHQAMPTSRYIDLTLGATGATYTAPADGYITLIKASNNVQQYIEISTGQVFANMNAHFSGQLLYATIPVSKGAIVNVNYNAGGSTNRFRFTYANGAR